MQIKSDHDLKAEALIAVVTLKFTEGVRAIASIAGLGQKCLK